MKRIHCIEWSGSLLKHGREKQYGLGQVQVHLPRNKHNKVQQQGEKIYSGLWLRPYAWPDNKLDGELLGCKRLKRQVLMSYINEEHWVALQRWYYIWLTFFFGWYCNGVSRLAFHSEKRGFDNSEIITGLHLLSALKDPKHRAPHCIWQRYCKIPAGNQKSQAKTKMQICARDGN